LKKKILIALKVIVSVSLLGYLFNKVDFEGVRDSLAKVSYWYLVAAAAVLLLQAVGGAVRLSMVIKTISSRINLRAALHIMFIGLFFNQTLPSSSCQDVYCSGPAESWPVGAIWCCVACSAIKNEPAPDNRGHRYTVNGAHLPHPRSDMPRYRKRRISDRQHYSLPRLMICR
jgi:hypothetical protein